MNKRFLYIILICLIILGAAAFFYHFYHTTKVDNLSRAEKYADNGELGKAYTEYQKALNNDPNNPEIVESLGNLAHRMGKLTESVEYYNRVNQMSPDTTRNIENAYWPNYLSGRFDEALDLCKKALNLRPDALIYYSYMADIYVIKAMEDKKYIQKAEEFIKKGDPKKGDTYYIRGKIFFLKGERESAVKSFEKAVTLGVDPADEMDINILLGHLYLWGGNAKKARDSFYKIIELERNWKEIGYLRLLPVPETAVFLLYTYSGENVKKEIIDELYSRYDALTEQGVVDTEGGREFHSTIMNAIAAKQKGDFEEALKYMNKLIRFKKAETHAPQCFVSRTLDTSLAPSLFNTFTGDIYLSKGDKIKARQFYKKALETSPLNPVIKSRLDSVK